MLHAHPPLSRLPRHLLLPLLLLTGALAGCTEDSIVSDKFRSGGQVSVPAGETVVHDLYIGAGTVDVQGTVQGDLLAAGGDVNVGGDVQDNVWLSGGNIALRGDVGGDAGVAGGSVTIEGPIGDDLRVFGGTITIRSTIPGDVVVTGGSVVLASSANVGGDIIANAGTLRIEGPVEGSVVASGDKVTLAGAVGGDVEARGRVTLEPTALIEGDLRYTSPDEAAIREGARVLGTTTRTTPRVGVLWWDMRATLLAAILIAVINRVQWFIGVLLVGLLLLWLFPATYTRAADTLRRSPLKSIGLGLAVVILLPIILLPLAIVALIIGGPPALPVLVAPAAVYIVAISITAPLVALMVGRLLLGRPADQPDGPNWPALLIGAGILAILTLIPVIGWLLALAIILFGFGAWILFGWRRYSLARSARVV